MQFHRCRVDAAHLVHRIHLSTSQQQQPHTLDVAVAVRAVERCPIALQERSWTQVARSNQQQQVVMLGAEELRNSRVASGEGRIPCR